MKITMIAIGSTGDVRPYMLLGRELHARGHEVTIASFEPFERMITEAGLRFFKISGDVVDMMSNIMRPGGNGVRVISSLEKTIRDVAPVLLRDLMRSCEGADALICTFFGSMYYSIAEKYRIPCIQTHYFPMDNNRAMPISSAPFQHLGPLWNSASYKIGYLLIGALEKRYLTDWRRENGMAPRKLHTRPDYISGGHRVPVIYAVSPQVMPRPDQWDEQIHMSGFWYDDTPCAWQPPQELRAFMEAGEPPIYVGFGSMVSGDMNHLFARVLRALRAARVRAVISTGWGGESLRGKSGNRIYFADDYVPHDWLFPRVKAVVHHGGAGTTASGLRAGKPTLVVPFGGDQPFWGARVHALGCGPRPIRREALTVNKLTRGILDLVTRDDYRVSAEALAESLRGEKGVRNAADVIEREIAAWREEGSADAAWD